MRGRAIIAIVALAGALSPAACGTHLVAAPADPGSDGGASGVVPVVVSNGVPDGGLSVGDAATADADAAPAGAHCALLAAAPCFICCHDATYPHGADVYDTRFYGCLCSAEDGKGVCQASCENADCSVTGNGATPECNACKASAFADGACGVGGDICGGDSECALYMACAQSCPQ